MIRPMLAAALLAAAVGTTAPRAQAQPLDCLAAGKLQITHVGRNQMPGGEGGGLAISVLIYNPQSTAQRFAISYNGPARSRVTNQERSRSAYQRQNEWVATLSGGSAITDQQIRDNITLLCF